MGEPDRVRGLDPIPGLSGRSPAAGENKPLYLGHPQFEGFEVRQSIGARKKANVAA